MAPVVVQGTAVSSGGGGGGGGSSQEPQRTKCNDIFFAVLGYVNLFIILGIAIAYGGQAFGSDDGSNADAGTSNTNAREYDAYIYAVLITGILSLVLSGLGMLVLMKFPEFIIKAALIFVILMGLVIAIISLMTGNIVGGVLGLVFFAIGVCYARAAWPRIPFASVNLTTAIDSIRANFGVVVFSYLFAIMGFVWTILWAVAFVGSLESSYECDDTETCDGSPSGVLLFFLFLSFFFGQQILQNSIHVQIAGVTATWWISPNENGFCGSAVINSFIRTMTTSFGSICFGSLLVAILQALKTLARQAQEGEGGIGACIAVCILGCLESILEYFNKWAFIYVGIYGMPYMEAGKSVFTLFQNRGWEAIIADDLVGNALFLVSFLVGLFMGAIAAAIAETSDMFDDAGGEDTTLIAFFLGFLVGFVISTILNSTFASGVNAVIVLFADCPNDLQRNHPQHSQKMRDTWRSIYPSEFQ